MLIALTVRAVRTARAQLGLVLEHGNEDPNAWGYRADHQASADMLLMNTMIGAMRGTARQRGALALGNRFSPAQLQLMLTQRDFNSGDYERLLDVHQEAIRAALQPLRALTKSPALRGSSYFEKIETMLSTYGERESLVKVRQLSRAVKPGRLLEC